MSSDEESVAPLWDPLWEYVLGDEGDSVGSTEDQAWLGSRSKNESSKAASTNWSPFKNRKTTVEHKPNNIDALSCVVPAVESRDEDQPSSRTSRRLFRQKLKKKGRQFWKRKSKDEAAPSYSFSNLFRFEENETESASQSTNQNGSKSSARQLGMFRSRRKSKPLDPNVTDSRVRQPMNRTLSSDLSLILGGENFEDEEGSLEQEPPEDQKTFFKTFYDSFVGSTGISPSDLDDDTAEADNIESREEADGTTVSSNPSESSSIFSTEESSLYRDYGDSGVSDSSEVEEVRLTFEPIESPKSGNVPSQDYAETSRGTPSRSRSQFGGNLTPASVSTEQTQLSVTSSQLSQLVGRSSRALAPAGSSPSIDRLQHYPRALNRMVCCSVKNLSPQQRDFVEKIGVPIHEISQAELTEIFPRLRSVGEDTTEVVGQGTFDDDLPAYLQTSLQIREKPQSLLEYAYDRGTHQCVTYSTFGPNAENIIHLNDSPEIEAVPEGTGDVIVQVEASTISLTDCFIRNGMWWRPDSVPLPNIPGVDYIGRICRVDSASSKKYGFSTGDRVLTLSKWGGNTRYQRIDPFQAVKVIDDVDPAEAVCLTETYLAAFQVLYQGLFRAKRYRANSLKGLSVVLLGCTDPKFVEAVSQLGAFGGVANIYVTAKQRRFRQLKELGIKPLSKTTSEWTGTLRGTVDHIISFEEKVSEDKNAILSKVGRITLVCCGDLDVDQKQAPTSKIVCQRNMSQQRAVTSVYDIYKEWDEKTELCKNDLLHLIDLLRKQIITPNVLDRLPLTKVAKAHQIVGSKRLSGYLVCEPWLVAKSKAVRL